ncbi:MAG: phosphotransferase, partial [Micropepsaceae bacterium]
MKKPVNLGYLDFSTLAKRRAALARELELNVRTAPATYLRLVPVVEKGMRLSLGGEGDVVEWLLEMRRFDDGALLAEVADRGALTEATVEQLAIHAARFHDGAHVVPGCDWPSAVARIARENTADLKGQAQIFAEHDLATAIAARERHRKFGARALARQSNDIRHCHGDMHLRNAFLDQGAPTLFDCIEFDDFYAVIPPLYDIAFLLMDLIARGMHRHANRALNAWAIHRAPDHWRAIMDSLAVLPLYLALRAEIRAKTEGRQPGGYTNAERYLTLASTFLERRPPRLIAIGGLSGAG